MKSLGKVIRSVQAFSRELSRLSGAIQPQSQPKIGIALGGGFARGIAHIGVLKVLEEEGIPVQFVAGTSVGALMGAAYCSGVTLAELEELAEKVRFTTFARWTLSRYGFASNDRMVSFLTRILKVHKFEELQIPLGVTATDFKTGAGTVFTSGSIIDPVRASCAYPGMFLPVRVNGRLLVDGLLSYAVPAPPLREMGADKVLAVSLSAHWCNTTTGPRHVFDVIGQCFSIAAEKMSGSWRKDADIVIEPDIACFGYDDFARAADLVRVGEKATREVLPQIKQWLETPATVAAPSMNLRPATSGSGPLQTPLTAK